MAYDKNYYEANKPRHRENQLAYMGRGGRQKQLDAGRCQRQRDPEHVYLVRVKSRYGLSPADLEARLQQQGGVCAICRNPDARLVGGTTKKKRLCVDHDHTTDKVRGLLCWDCNLALGALKDDPLRARAAAAYLESGGV